MIHELSVGEKLIGSGVTTLMGMGITFIVLFFLWGCIALMARIMNRGNGSRPPGAGGAGTGMGREKAVPAADAPGSGQCFHSTGAPHAARTGDTFQSISTTRAAGNLHITAAIITAAVTAYDSSGNGLIVRSIRRMPEKKLWAITAPGRSR